MQLTIKNFRGISAADIELSKITLLAAPNEGGKTSASQALAAALTGEPVPIVGVKKTQAGLLVRSGAANGSVDLTSDTGATNIQWPSAKTKTEGQAPFATHYAAGLLSIVNLDEKERIKVLTEYLKAVPTRADFDKALTAMDLPKNVMDQLWDLVVKQGWDNAAAQIKDKGARLKGQWEGITGDRYGSKKGESYIPAGYDNELMGESEDKLKAIVTDCRDALEGAIATDAIDDSRRAELESLAASLDQAREEMEAAAAETLDPAMLAQISEADGFIKHLQEQKAGIEKAKAELPQPDSTFSIPCPACGVHLELMPGKKLSVAVPIDAAENTRRMAAISEADSKIQGVQKAIQDHMASVSSLRVRVSEFDQAKLRKVAAAEHAFKRAQSAQAELNSKTGEATDQTVVDGHRRTLSLAESRLKAFQQKTEADRLHLSIEKNTELYKLIGAEGIRSDVLAKALKDFNTSMETFCKAAGWRAVALEPDFLPTYGGTLYMLLSESAKFRVRVVLQIAMAMIDKSSALIIDAADILDKGGRNGLFRAVKASGLPSLVAMTIDSKELVPNLGKAGLGASYWIQDAKAEVV